MALQSRDAISVDAGPAVLVARALALVHHPIAGGNPARVSADVMDGTTLLATEAGESQYELRGKPGVEFIVDHAAAPGWGLPLVFEDRAERVYHLPSLEGATMRY
jgi:hypothetical protein